MQTSNANQVNLQKQKFVPATNYSPPTCHSALQAVKNKQLKQEQGQAPAREFGVKFEIGSGPVRPPEPQPSHYQFGNRFSNGNSGNSFVAELNSHLGKPTSNNNNNNNEDDVDVGNESNRKLARTWSVGKLVNNFETPSQSHADSDQSNSVRDLRQPTNVYHKFSAPSLPSGFQLANGSAKPFLAPKPPSLVGGVKPLLRHTVSLVIPVARRSVKSVVGFQFL